MMEEVEQVEILPPPIKGRADWRSYRAFRLSNGVIGLAVEDRESKTTGMACLVNVGAAADPRELSGLAHFCEHMCFLGSEKYPGENEYKRFLSSHGGQSNASTSMQCTNYKAEVLADHAEQAFDIFSNFFVAPLFSLSGTSREVNAIDSENSKNLTSDDRRRLQILKALADPNHWYSKFSTGHAQTLDTEQRLEYVREALLAFHRKHYRPSNMTVVLAGPQSLDTLQKWIVERYSKIPRSHLDAAEEKTEIELLIDQAAAEAPPNSLTEPPPPFRSPFTPKQQGGSWPVLLTTKPLKSMRKVILMWPIPSNDNRVPDQSVSSILSHLLGHEGAGSAFAVLQDHGMLNSLSAGPRTRAPDFTLFQVDLGLTEKGERHWQQVVDVIFQYCRLLNDTLENNHQELARIWGEMSRLDQMFFHQTSPGGVYSYAPNLADRVLSYGTEKALSAGQMLDETEDSFPLEKVKEVVKLLTPANCIVERCSEMAWDEAMAMTIDEDIFGTKKEPWYGIDYHLSDIKNHEILASWNGSSSSTMMENDRKASKLTLPRPNRYIPRTLDLCPDLPEEAKQGPRLDVPINPPTLLVDDAHGQLFHRLDDRYALPKSSLTFFIRNAAVQNVKTAESSFWEYDDKTALLSSMLSGAFGDAMAQETYDADLAGLHWSLSMTSAGIKLSFYGFSDRLPDLGMTILKEFLSGDFLRPRYLDATKDRVIRSLQTYFESRRADSHAVYYRDALMASKDKGIDESLALAQLVDLDDLQKHFNTILSNSEISFECLFTGNVSARDAKDFYMLATTNVLKSLKLRTVENVEKPMIPSGMVERRVNPGEDIELHFASKNPSEENGAVICSYQSSIPAYKGDGISHPESLESTAAIRLISRMLREPLFDDLRTKQQLGYVVSAYYEIGLSSRSNEEINSMGPLSVPVDFITVVILSRKLAPPDIVKRIDDFMSSFRESLINMPESEIRDHAKALSTMLLKPIQKLQTEATNHFEKIHRYGPEIVHSLQKDGRSGRTLSDELPWNSVQSLAGALGKLTHQDLLITWDRMTQPATRSRIVSCVYGKTFPLQASIIKLEPKCSKLLGWGFRRPVVRVVNSFPDLLHLRAKFRAFDDQMSQPSHRRLHMTDSFVGRFQSQPLLWTKIGVGAILGAGIVGLTAMSLAFRYHATRPPSVTTRRNN